MNTVQERAARYARTLTQIAKSQKATSVGLAENEISVRYHDTIVFYYAVDTGDIELQTGGWDTPTTRRRLNTCLDACGIPAQANRHKGKTWIHFRTTGQTVPFDGLLHFNLGGLL